MKNLEILSKHIGVVAESNWESNVAPQQHTTKEAYKSFFIGSHLGAYQMGLEDGEKSKKPFVVMSIVQAILLVILAFVK